MAVAENAPIFARSSPQPLAVLFERRFGYRLQMDSVTRNLAEGALFTDLYQLTMVQLYWQEGIALTPARFEHSFRTNPDYGTHQAGYCINAGMADLIDWMNAFRFSQGDLEYLATLGNPEAPTFGTEFLGWLGSLEDAFGELTITAIPEGRAVFPGVPLTVVEGPLAMCQLLETALLNHLCYPTLIATKASRIADSARGRPTFEFGLRRGPQFGATAGVRAAIIGGATSTSFVGAAQVLGVSPAGTHAHAMVQAIDALGGGELEAFRAYAKVYPEETLLLVDTFSTLKSGVPNAITVFDELKEQGHTPVGIRLDSGDLAHLAVRSSALLTAAGFPDVSIVLSGGLAEFPIWQILTQIEQEAPEYGVDADQLIDRLIFGVGTKLLTSEGAPSLDGVYKLVAVQQDGEWKPAYKISENPAKRVIPGHKQVVRIYDQSGRAVADVLAVDEEDISTKDLKLRDPKQASVSRVVGQEEISEIEPLLETVWNGSPVPGYDDIDAARARRLEDLDRLHPGVRRLVRPHVHHVSLTEDLWNLLPIE